MGTAASTCSMQFLDKDFIPDALQPFKGKLTERFFEVRSRVIDFITEVCNPATAKYIEQAKANKAAALKEHGAYWGRLISKEPAILNELRREAEKRGLSNFFLPEVSGLSVMEYSPIGEIMGA